MALVEEETAADPPLPAVLRQEIDKFNSWAREHLQAEQDRNAIYEPLYHYTDGRGLKGVLESGQLWFTDYRHLNDPSELIHGINMAHHVARLIGAGADKRVQLFLETFVDMFRDENFEATLEFFIASFSRARDELGQWRAYADNGRGFVIGFSPGVFSIVNQLPTDRPPEFVGPVLYTDAEICARHKLSLSESGSYLLERGGGECRPYERQIGRYSIHAGIRARDYGVTANLELSHVEASGLRARTRGTPSDHGPTGTIIASCHDPAPRERDCPLYSASYSNS